jgi:3-phenylpropionate/trans-cinnamate dioxygenase ferredoxin reductase subunit
MATELALPTSCDEGAYWNREADQDLVCVDVRQETHDVKTFTSRAKDDRYFSFDAGQYFLFELEIDGEMVSRCYSVSSSAMTPSRHRVPARGAHPGGPRVPGRVAVPRQGQAQFPAAVPARAGR